MREIDTKNMDKFICVLICVFILIELVACSISITNKHKYSEASYLLETGNCEEAITLIENIKNFETDEDLVRLYNRAHTAVVYKNACSLYNEGKYQEAAILFKSIPNYLDSEDKANECIVQYGIQLAEDEENS